MPMRPQVGQLINNKYRLVRQIGDGGMGSVFEATHEVLGSSVALKFLHSELARRSGLVQRFLQEARVSAKIDSPHVVRVTDVEQTPDGLPFIVMEFLQGKSLQALYEELYRKGERLPYDQAMRYALQMLDGIEAAHDTNVVHRDLKPDNVMIVKGKRGEPTVKVLDFGIAKLRINGELTKGLTRPGVIMGTPEYMAPEQVFSADAVDARADIFSCGVMIFEMLAGRRPVGGDEPHQIAAQYLAGTIAQLADLAPQIAPELAAAVHKAMASDPKDRFDTIEQFRTEIARFTMPGLQGGRPSTPSAGTERVHMSSVPKTIPPAEGPVVAASAALASPAGISWEDPPGMADGGATEKVAEPWRGDDPDHAGAAAPNGGSTVEAEPFFPGSTEAYQPVGAKSATRGAGRPVSDHAAVARPGGTAIGAKGAHAPSTATVAPRIDASPRAAHSPYAGAQGRPRKKAGLGVVGILAIGLAASAALMGGLYAFDQFGRSSGGEEDQRTMPLPTHKKKVNDGEPKPPVAQPEPPPAPTWQTSPQTTPKQTSTPTQPASTQPKPHPTHTTPKPQPTTPAPWMIPSAIPMPGIPGWPPDLGLPGAQPPPPSNTSPGRPKLEPIRPGGSLEQPQPGNTARPPAAEPPKRAERPTRLPRIPRGTTASTRPAATTAPKPETSAKPTAPPAGSGTKRPIKLRDVL